MLLISKIQMNILLSLEIFYITICEDSIDEITKKMTREVSTKRNAKLCFWWQQNTLVAKCILLIIKSVFIWPLHFSQLLSLVLKVSLQAIWKISWKFEEQTLRNTKQNVYLCWNSWWWFFSIQVFHSLYLLTLLLCQLFLLNTVTIWFKTVLNLEPHLL